MKNNAFGITIVLLVAMLILETYNNPSVWNFVTGKTPLTQSGTTLQNSLTKDAKLALGWIVGALLLLAFVTIAPESGLMLALILFTLVAFSHGKAVTDVTNFLTGL